MPVLPNTPAGPGTTVTLDPSGNLPALNGANLTGVIPAALPVTTRSAAGALPSTDAVVLVNTSGGSFALSLPNPATFTGRLLYLLDSTGSFATNNLTLTRFGAEKIAGLAASRIFQTAWGGWIVLTNGTDWFVI